MTKMHYNAKDITGQRFGKLVAVKPTKKRSWGSVIWECLCDCGNKTEVVIQNLTMENTQSCGCIHSKQLIERNTSHGLSKTRIYRLWKDMRDRCRRKSHISYKYYGAMGVIVCERWNNFKNFHEDMFGSYQEHIKKYGQKQTTIDRINPFGNYEPNNCRWATYSEQVKNTRKNYGK